jgi:predicted RNA-binding Zn-ribbon protein involved in translation (DUF1610 family)
VVSDYHRRALADTTLTVHQLHLTSERLILILEKAVPKPYAPSSLLSLDTNEGSLDGATVGAEGTRPARVDYSEIPILQRRHMERRRRLARRKATDRRLRRVLLGREGRREHDRVRSRLHVLSKRMVAVAAGVPVVWVNPYLTSRSCPRCGAVKDRRRRVGPVFECDGCGWRMDRQLNAGQNIGRTALGFAPELGGLQLDPDALLQEGMRPRCPWAAVPRATEDGRAGRDDGSGGGLEPPLE